MTARVLSLPAAKSESILAAIEGWAAKTPHAVAVLQPGREHATYRTLSHQIECIALSLDSAEIQHDDIVALALSDGADLCVGQFGVIRHCACALSNPALTRSEFENYFSLLRPSALLCDSSAKAASEAADALGIATLDATPVPGPAGSFRVLPRTPGKRNRETRKSDARFIFQTSGTTGRPKLVPLTDAICMARASSYRDKLLLTEADRALCLSPQFLHQGWMASMAQLLAGGSVAHPGRFAPEHFLQWLAEYRPTWYSAGPAIHRAIVSLLGSDNVILPCPLRFVRSSGAPLDHHLLTAVERTLGVPVIEGYGLTETGSIACTTLHTPRKVGAAGQTTGTRIAIRDEAGQELPAGTLGEITVSGIAVIETYCDELVPSFSNLGNNWFRTGDLGILDDQGFLFLAGRLHERINRGGEKVMPQEVEAVLHRHPAVREAVAFGVPHETLGEEVACAVVLEPDSVATEWALREFAALHLTAFKVPRQIFFRHDLPRNAGGKPQRSELRELVTAASSTMLRQPRIAPRSPIERQLKSLWTRILRSDEIGIDDNFFDLGGDSLKSAVMLTEVNATWRNARILSHTSTFFRNPTIETLAAIVTAQLDRVNLVAPDIPIIPLRSSGSRIPIFCIPAADEYPLYLRHLADRLGDNQPFFILNTSGSGTERGLDSVEMAASRSLNAIRRMNVRGPYVLSGHCYGGIVAYEVARRLVAEGEAVALVALLDVPAPGYPKVLRHWRRYAAAFRLELTSWKSTAELLRRASEHARHLAYLTRRKLVLKRVRRKQHHQDQYGADPVRNPCSYEPKSLDVPVMQFIAIENAASTTILEDARFGWRDFAVAEFGVRRVPGGHASLLAEPNANALAAELIDVLDRFNAEIRR